MSKKFTIAWITFVFLLFLVTAIFCFKSNRLLLIISELVIPVLYSITVWIIGRLMKPVSTIARSLNMLKEGDFSTTMVKTGNNEVDTLISVYNSMIKRLREERLSIREKNLFLDLLIDSSPMGIIVLNLDERISDINAAADKFIGLSGIYAKGKTLHELDSILGLSLASVSNGEKQTIVLSDGRKYLCSRLFFMDHGFKHPFFIIEELTEEIRKAEKEAYGKLIRMMAHEVNNTIGSVNSIMESVANSPASFNENEREEILDVLNVAIQRNYQMNKFMQNFSNVVKLPLPIKDLTDINKSVQLVADSFLPVCKLKNISVLTELDPSLARIYVDRSQMEQVFSNIIKNSVEAIGTTGLIKITTVSFPPSVVFEDNGSGLKQDVSEKLFTPFFSSKPGGQGIGLTLTREILSNHDFRFTFNNKTEGGTKFSIVFVNK